MKSSQSMAEYQGRMVMDGVFREKNAKKSYA